MNTAYALVPSPSHVYPDHPEHPSRFDLLTTRLDFLRRAKNWMRSPPGAMKLPSVHHPDLITALEKAANKVLSSLIMPHVRDANHP